MSQSPTRIVLSRAREMIKDPNHWVQGSWKCPLADGSFRRCAYQAVHDAANEIGLPDLAALKALARAVGDGRRAPRRVIPGFNDQSTHKEVLALFDRALANA